MARDQLQADQAANRDYRPRWFECVPREFRRTTASEREHRERGFARDSDTWRAHKRKARD